DVRVAAAADAAGDPALDTALASVMTGRRAASSAASTVLRGQKDEPYAEMWFPTAEYRLLALFRLWNVMHYFFPYKHLMDTSWDDALAEFIPKFEANKTTLDYELTVYELAARLQDSHVTVGNATAVSRHLGEFAPPIFINSVEGQTVIAALA